MASEDLKVKEEPKNHSLIVGVCFLILNAVVVFLHNGQSFDLVAFSHNSFLSENNDSLLDKVSGVHVFLDRISLLMVFVSVVLGSILFYRNKLVLVVILIIFGMLTYGIIRSVFI